MPLYEYGCSSCGGRLERRQRFDEAPLSQCPTCGGVLYRIIQPAGIIFKGSGWYCTDSRASATSEKTGDTAHTSTEAPTADASRKEKSTAGAEASA